MLNNLNSTIITPLSPKNQKKVDSKIIHNEYCNDISPEFLNTKNKTVKKYLHSTNIQNNDTSNFLLFTPADICHSNLSITNNLNEIIKPSFTTTTSSSDIDTTNFSSTASILLNDNNSNTNFDNKSYSIDFSSNDLPKNCNEISLENNDITNCHLFNNNNKKNKANIINNMVNNNNNNNIISQTSNLFNTLSNKKELDELSNPFYNYNLVSNNIMNICQIENENNSYLDNTKDSKIFNVEANNKLLEFEKNINDFDLNNNLLNSQYDTKTLSSLFSNYQNQNNLNISYANNNNMIISNINNVNPPIKNMENTLTENRKRKIEMINYRNVNESDENEALPISNELILNNKNIINIHKKLKTTNDIINDTYHLINKINKSSFIDNKIQHLNNSSNNKINEEYKNIFEDEKEFNDISLNNNNNNNNTLYTANDTQSLTYLPLNLSENIDINIFKEKTIHPLSISNNNKTLNSYNQNNKNEQLDIINDLNKMNIEPTTTKEELNDIKNMKLIKESDIKKNDEKKTKLVIKISKKMLKQHDDLSNDKKNVLLKKHMSKNIESLIKVPAKLKSMINMSRSQFSYMTSNNDLNIPITLTPKESRQIRNIAEQLYNLNSMYRFTDETLYLAMNYIYRYTRSVCRVQSKMLELIILTSMYIAGKFNEELNEPTITDIMSSSTSVIKMNDVKKMERKMLSKLNWNLYITSPQSVIIEYINYLKETTGLAKPIEKYISSFRAFNYIINNNFGEFIYPVFIIAFSELLLLPANFNINKNSIIKFLSLNKDDINQLNECLHLLFERVKERRFKKISIRNNCICDKCLKNNKK
ncbi:hypothetical protein BCR32DRAFT_283551 [Anaeromyces robustus]|uniref:Cyclin-like domain-containing protein n=1 Tax=Anaeromyces robustus TaxID=1754192 RepID=A0A1Y1WUS8_9FUNG|nr:hypothetical protein BCR32DRAFT_283551 [Anaeromyces robustus]|eukprot:ORX77048.1 hypothetical protein BCR32DRAFT_283551 [Anaeromyces robustus]